MANVFLRCELQESPQFQSCLIVHLVLLRVWSDSVPFNCGHSYVRTQYLSVNRGPAWEHQSCWKEVNGTSHSQSPANIICSPPSRVEMQRKAGPIICFPFQLSLKTLNFLTVSWGSVDCNQNWLASSWRAWAVLVAEVQCNISVVARHRADKKSKAAPHRLPFNELPLLAGPDVSNKRWWVWSCGFVSKLNTEFTHWQV